MYLLKTKDWVIRNTILILAAHCTTEKWMWKLKCMGQTCLLVGPQNLSDLSEMALVQHAWLIDKSGHGLEQALAQTLNGDHLECFSLKLNIKIISLQWVQKIESPARKRKEVSGKVTCNPSFMFCVVAFVALWPWHCFFPAICYSISNRLPCSHVYISLLPITRCTTSISSKHMES